MSIAKASDIIALLDNLNYRALTFRAELFPLVGDSPFFIAPPTFAGHEVKLGDGIAKHKFIGKPREDGSFPMVELESAEQFAKRLQRTIAAYLPKLSIDVDGETIDLLQLVHGTTDGFLRESTLNGVAFRETDIGAALFAGNFQQKMQARYQHFPHRLLTGECDMQSGQSKDNMLVFGGCMWAQAIGVNALPLAAPKLGHMPLALTDTHKTYLPSGPGRTLLEAEAGPGKAKGTKKGGTITSYNLVNAGNKSSITQTTYHGAMVSSAHVQGSLDFAGLRQLGLDVAQQTALVALWLLGVHGNIKNYLPRKNAGLRAKSISWSIVPSFGDDISLETVDIGEHLLEGAPAWHKQSLQLTATDLVVKHRRLALEKAMSGEEE